MKNVKLGDVCKIVNGGTPKTGVRDYWDGGILWITPKDLGKIKSSTTSTTQRTLSEQGINNSSAKLIPENSIILSTRAPIGYLVINTEPMSFNQGCKGIIPGDQVDVKYLYHYLKHNRKKLNELGTGTTFPELSMSALSKLDVPLPSLQKQKLIVHKLDRAFEKIDQAIKLTQENFNSSRDLFESIAEQQFSQIKYSYKSTLGDVYDVRDGTHDSPEYLPSGYPLVTSKNLKIHTIDLSNVSFISKKDYVDINKRSRVDIGDVLFAMIGTIGNPVVVEVEPNFAIKNVALFKKKNDSNPYFLKHYLASRSVKAKMIAEARGSTQKFVGLGYLRNFPIYIPSPDIQNQIVARLEEALNLSQKLMNSYGVKIKMLEDLKQSMLEESFRMPSGV